MPDGVRRVRGLPRGLGFSQRVDDDFRLAKQANG